MSSKTWQMPAQTHAWLVDHTVRESPSLAALRVETATMASANMQISPEQGRFLQWLVRTLAVRRVVEVGTFTGYSALAMALALPDDGEIVCCDVSEPWTDIARRHWQAAGVANKVRLRLAPAVQTLDALLDDGQAGTFDLAFVDADKHGYPAYIERCVALLRPGGVLAVDNTLWSGKVADPDVVDEDTQAIRAAIAQVVDDVRLVSSLVPIGDGLLLATRR
jgi:caffeoyl-CoA O-methyltransferase